MRKGDVLLSIEQVEKTYTVGPRSVTALRGVNLQVKAGEFVALMGPSGCGKSTLLHLIGGMDRPTHGHITCGGVSLATLHDAALAHFRRRRVGFVFQFFNLLPTLTVVENVALPLLLDGVEEGRAQEQAKRLLARVGLQERVAHFPAALSGGELQRAAVARAVISQPELVLADEPTGSLDSMSGKQVMQLLAELNRELHVTIILATHAEEAAGYAKRLVRLRDGLIEIDTFHAAAL
jgi:putative ABC transport system ATP-binding protein